MAEFTEDSDDLYKELLEGMKERSFCVLGTAFKLAGNNDDYGGFCYSVGNTDRGLPEIIIAIYAAGLDAISSSMDLAKGYLCSLLSQHPGGEWLNAGSLSFDGAMMYKRVSKESHRFPGIMEAVNEESFLKRYYGDTPFECIIFSDEVTIH